MNKEFLKLKKKNLKSQNDRTKSKKMQNGPTEYFLYVRSFQQILKKVRSPTELLCLFEAMMYLYILDFIRTKNLVK